MAEMIERVARAMMREDIVLASSEAAGAEFSRGDVFDRLARAAIEAMREPSAAMVAATVVQTQPASARDYETALLALDKLPPSEHPDVADVLAEVARDHRAMIDAALRGPE